MDLVLYRAANDVPVCGHRDALVGMADENAGLALGVDWRDQPRFAASIEEHESDSGN